MHIELDSVLRFPMNCPNRQKIIHDLVLPNPKYESAKAFGSKSALHATPENVYYFTDDYQNMTTTTPVGKKDALFNFCKDCHYQCPVYDNRKTGSTIKDVVFSKEIKLRPSQHKAIEAIQNSIVNTGCGIVVIPVGGGKSILAFMVSYLSQKSTLFVTHTLDLCQQAYDDYESIFGTKPGFIGDGRYELNPQFTVAIVDSLYSKKNYEELSSLFGLLIIDEVHLISPESCIEIANNMSCKWKLGLTGTLNRGDGLTPAIKASLGEVVYEVSVRDVQKEGSLVPLQAYTLQTNYRSPYDNDSFRKKKTLINSAIKDASLDVDRNKIIANHAIELCQYNHSVLLVLQNIEQCLVQYDLLQNQPNVRPEIFVGQVGKKKFSRKDRKEIINRARSGETNVLITVQLAGIGLDVPRLTCLILDRKLTDPTAVTQIVGRVVRACPQINKQCAYLWDVEDVNVPLFKEQTNKRFYVYNKFRQY